MVDKITLTNLANLQNENTAVAAINANNVILVDAINNTLSRDGEAPNKMEDLIDMDSHRIINLPNAVSDTEPVTFGTFNSVVIGRGNVPVGGAANQILSKTTSTDYDSAWTNITSKLTAGSNISITGTTNATIATSATPSLSSIVLNGATSGTTTIVPLAVASGTITIPSATDTLVGKATTDTLTNKTLTTPLLVNPQGQAYIFAGGVSGTTVLQAQSAASGTVTLPAATDTLVGKATTDTLTNKTYDTAGAGNSFSINGLAATANTGTGTVVRQTSPTINSPTFTAPVLGTPASGVATNLTGTAASLTAGNVTTNANLTGPITSTGNTTAVASQTGTGSTFVMNTTPTLVTPVLGVATATTVNKVTLTAPATNAVLTIPDGVTLTGPATSGTAMTLGNAETITGVKTFGSTGNVGRLKVAGTTSGTTILDASAVAGGTLTLPNATDTLVARNTVDTFTNKTFDTAGSGNLLRVAGVNVAAGQYLGEPSTGSAVSGNIGEYQSQTVVSGSAVALTTAVQANITSTLVLGPGDWDVWLNFYFTGGVTTLVSFLSTSISFTSATIDTTPGRFGSYLYAPSAAIFNVGNGIVSVPAGAIRAALSGSTNIFGVAQAVFSTSTCSCYGTIQARRAR